YRLPVMEAQDRISAYLQHPETSYIAHDAITGWIPNPGASKESGKYIHNRQGIRSDGRTYALSPGKDTVRIALLGDSYVYGDEVALEETLGHQLEGLLGEHRAVEVINFGVGAFGMDQAYLHWKHHVQAFQPHIVLFGLQPENAFRNTNLVRKFYNLRALVPFMKPRFILEGDSLQLINCPTPRPERVPNILEEFEQWPLARYEAHFHPEDFAPSWWQRSRLMAYAQDVFQTNRFNIATNEHEAFAVDGEAATLTLALIRKMQQDITASGAAFYLIHLPRKEDLEDLREGRPLRYAALLEAVEATATTIRPESGFVQTQDHKAFEALFAPRRHYAGGGHGIVAERMASYLLREMELP
ncbi:MAG: hypothetical protein AAGB22_12540, partial [Bacteroidota bacterium]